MLFLYGMKIMSEAVQQFAGGNMRRRLAGLTASPLRGIVTGTLITGVVQSSSGVTVMIVSFVNAGLLTLSQAFSMVMGANIGTTVTGWLVAFFSFQLNLDVILTLILFGIGFPLTLLQRSRVRALGNAILGFSLLMMAMGLLNEIVTEALYDPDTVRFITGFEDAGHLRLPAFALIGLAGAVIFQSSSATLALTFILCIRGLIPLDCAAAMVLGQNLGTTATANIAAIVTNRNGKRTALFHTLFNLTGILWALPLLRPTMHQIAELFTVLGIADPYESTAVQPYALAFLHTFFNLATTLLTVGFIPQFVRLTRWIIPVKKEGDTTVRFIKSPLFSTGELTVVHAHQILLRHARQSFEMFGQVRDYFRSVNPGDAGEMFREITRTKEEHDATRETFSAFLFKTGIQEASEENKMNILVFFQLISDVGFVTDHLYSIADTIRRKKEKNIWFPRQLRDRFNEMIELVDHSAEQMTRNLSSIPVPAAGLHKAAEYRQTVSETVMRIRDTYSLLKEESDEEITYEAGIVYSELINYTEQLSYAITKISEDAHKVVMKPVKPTENHG